MVTKRKSSVLDKLVKWEKKAKLLKNKYGVRITDGNMKTAVECNSRDSDSFMISSEGTRSTPKRSITPPKSSSKDKPKYPLTKKQEGELLLQRMQEDIKNYKDNKKNSSSSSTIEPPSKRKPFQKREKFRIPKRSMRKGDPIVYHDKYGKSKVPEKLSSRTIAKQKLTTLLTKRKSKAARLASRRTPTPKKKIILKQEIKYEDKKITKGRHSGKIFIKPSSIPKSRRSIRVMPSKKPKKPMKWPEAVNWKPKGLLRVPIPWVEQKPQGAKKKDRYSPPTILKRPSDSSLELGYSPKQQDRLKFIKAYNNMRHRNIVAKRDKAAKAIQKALKTVQGNNPKILPAQELKPGVYPIFKQSSDFNPWDYKTKDPTWNAEIKKAKDWLQSISPSYTDLEFMLEYQRVTAGLLWFRERIPDYKEIIKEEPEYIALMKSIENRLEALQSKPPSKKSKSNLEIFKIKITGEFIIDRFRTGNPENKYKTVVGNTGKNILVTFKPKAKKLFDLGKMTIKSTTIFYVRGMEAHNGNKFINTNEIDINSIIPTGDIVRGIHTITLEDVEKVFRDTFYINAAHNSTGNPIETNINVRRHAFDKNIDLREVPMTESPLMTIEDCNNYIEARNPKSKTSAQLLDQFQIDLPKYIIASKGRAKSWIKIGCIAMLDDTKEKIKNKGEYAQNKIRITNFRKWIMKHYK